MYATPFRQLRLYLSEKDLEIETFSSFFLRNIYKWFTAFVVSDWGQVIFK